MRNNDFFSVVRLTEDGQHFDPRADVGRPLSPRVERSRPDYFKFVSRHRPHPLSHLFILAS